MADSETEFDVLMRRVREGSEDAAREVLERYGEYILRAVRSRLNRRLRSKYDSADFVQAVWASFFAGAPKKYSFDHPAALIAFLAALAQNKVVEAVRQRLATRKHDVTREQSLDASYADDVPAHGPSPSQIAAANDEWRHLLRDLPAHYQRILALLREGHTQREVAEELGIAERTVRRVLYKLNAEPAG